jgi:hypothetical protein
MDVHLIALAIKLGDSARPQHLSLKIDDSNSRPEPIQSPRTTSTARWMLITPAIASAIKERVSVNAVCGSRLSARALRRSSGQALFAIKGLRGCAPLAPAAL